MSGIRERTADDMKHRLAALKPVLAEKYHINRVGIFGSYVRGEQQTASDLDVLIDYDDAPSLLTLIELEDYLSDMMGIRVDLVTMNGIKRQLKDQILNEVEYI